MGSAQRALAMARCLSRISGVAGDREPARFRVSFKVLYPAAAYEKRKGHGLRLNKNYSKLMTISCLRLMPP
jgi:hypothetical protein